MERVKTIFEQAMEILNEGMPLLEDQNQKEYFEKSTEYLNNAKEIANTDEKIAVLDNLAVSYANQICFILFREDKITESLTKQIRELITPEETKETAQKFNAERQARIDELNKQHEVIVDEQKDLDVFFGVMSGKSVEEAKDLMAKHEEDIKQAGMNN